MYSSHLGLKWPTSKLLDQSLKCQLSITGDRATAYDSSRAAGTGSESRDGLVCALQDSKQSGECDRISFRDFPSMPAGAQGLTAGINGLTAGAKGPSLETVAVRGMCQP